MEPNFEHDCFGTGHPHGPVHGPGHFHPDPHCHHLMHEIHDVDYSSLHESVVTKIARRFLALAKNANSGTALFDGFVDENIIVEAVASSAEDGRVLFSVRDKAFVYEVDNRYYDDWRSREAYMNDDFTLRTDKVYVYGGYLWYYSTNQRTLVKYGEVMDENVHYSEEQIRAFAKNEAQKEDVNVKTYSKTEATSLIKSFWENLSIKTNVLEADDFKFEAGYDKDKNEMTFTLKVPDLKVFGIEDEYIYSAWKIDMKVGTKSVKAAGETVRFAFSVYRTKTRVKNGEPESNFEIEFADETPTVNVVDVDYVSVDNENGTFAVEANTTNKERTFVLEATCGLAEKATIEIKQCK